VQGGNDQKEEIPVRETPSQQPLRKPKLQKKTSCGKRDSAWDVNGESPSRTKKRRENEKEILQDGGNQMKRTNLLKKNR